MGDPEKTKMAHLLLIDDLWWFTGWWYTYPSQKYEFVSSDDYSQYMEK